jgi:hypothetical protein
MLSVPSFGRSGAKKISNAKQEASGFFKNFLVPKPAIIRQLNPAWQTADFSLPKARAKSSSRPQFINDLTDKTLRASPPRQPMPETITELSRMTRGLACTSGLLYAFDARQNSRGWFRLIAAVRFHSLEFLQERFPFLLLPAADQVTHHIAGTGVTTGFPARV